MVGKLLAHNAWCKNYDDNWNGSVRGIGDGLVKVKSVADCNTACLNKYSCRQFIYRNTPIGPTCYMVSGQCQVEKASAVFADYKYADLYEPTPAKKMLIVLL